MGEDIDDNGDDDDDNDDENSALLLLLLPPPGTRVCGEVPGDDGILGNGGDKQGRGEMGVSGIPLPSIIPLLSLLSSLHKLEGAPSSCTSGTRCGGESEAHTSWVVLVGQEQSPPMPHRRPILPSHANSSLHGVGSPESAAPSNRPPSWLQHLKNRDSIELRAKRLTNMDTTF